MNIVEAIFLGLVQGLTEFIPVSSSGHLVIAQTFFSGASNHLFLEWINIGTVLALIIYFRRRISGIIKEIFVEKRWKTAVNILIAAIPAGLAGFFLADFIASAKFFGSVWTVVVTLAVVGILLILLEKLPKLSNIKNIESLPWLRALSIGIAQVMALIPGVSRSGSTIVAGRIAGFSRANAAEFSFLVSIPIMIGVILKLLVSSTDRLYFAENALTLTLGNLSAFISGLVAVGFLMRFLEKKSLAVFGWYRLGLAATVLVLLASGVLA